MSPKAPLPIPQGNYLPAVRYADLIYTSGMTPRENGVLLYAGKIQAEVPIMQYKEAVRLSTHNALTAVQSLLEEGEMIKHILQLTVYLNAVQDFTQHPKVADFASVFLAEVLGECGIGSRAAVGVATLPSNATVEITLVAVIGKVEK